MLQLARQIDLVPQREARLPVQQKPVGFLRWREHLGDGGVGAPMAVDLDDDVSRGDEVVLCGPRACGPRMYSARKQENASVSVCIHANVYVYDL